MNQLPPHQGRIRVGSAGDLNTEQYAEGNEVVWYSMRSCTSDENVARRFVAMLTKCPDSDECSDTDSEVDTEICTLLILDVQNAGDMTPLSLAFSEANVLLAASTTFQIINRKRVGMVNEIHLTEVGSILT